MKRHLVAISCVIGLVFSCASVAGAATFTKGQRVMAAASGVHVRDSTLVTVRYTQTGGVHGTVIGGPKTSTAGSYTLTWWQIRWDSELPEYASDPGWSAEAVGSTAYLLAAPTAGDAPKPSFTVPCYTTANIYWTNGYAPASTSPPDAKLGIELGCDTWYAYGRMLQLGYSPTELAEIAPAGTTGASQWPANARTAGLTVDTTPAVGAIGVIGAGLYAAGHAVVVESVNGDGTITVTESSSTADNVELFDWLWRHRTTTPTRYENYIHVTKLPVTGPLTIATESLPGGTTGAAYSETLAADGGTAPIEWSVSSGTLPAGLDIDGATGEISGTPTVAEAAAFTVRATDLLGATDTKALSIEVFPAAPQAGLRWLDITKLQVGLPATTAHDSCALKGVLNMWPGESIPQSVTLHLGNWSVAMDAASWKRVGKTNAYTWSQGGVTAKMTYWVKGTSKCQFQFSGSKQTLAASLTALPDVPVRLEVGSSFDKTITATMTVRNRAAKLASVSPLPLFLTQTFTMKRNLIATGKDSLSFKAKVILASDFDPAADAMNVGIGPYDVDLPANTMPAAKNGLVTYTTPTAHGKLVVKFSNKAHTLTVTATGVDLSSATQAQEVRLNVLNHPGANWDYGLLMSKDKKGAKYAY